MRETVLASIAIFNGLVAVLVYQRSSPAPTVATVGALPNDLHSVYDSFFKGARYVDLTHSIHPGMPLWPGFSQPTAAAALAGSTTEGYIGKGEPYEYGPHGFVATAYSLPTDQLGTQLDPPAHWDEYGATIDQVPPTVSLRPLIVIDLSGKTQKDGGYHASAKDVIDHEAAHGRVPAGSVVMFRTGWSAGWDDYGTSMPATFPGVGLSALRLLHQNRSILMHGHEPLDTDMTPALEGEAWLLHMGYMQLEGVANLHLLPPTGCLVSIGFPKFLGGTGGYARLVAICPPAGAAGGVTIDEAPGAPLPSQPAPLRRGADGVMRPTASATPTRYCKGPAAAAALGCPVNWK